MAALTIADLGKIVLDAVGREAIESGYAHSADNLAQVGISALMWGDITEDGTLT